MRISPQAVCCYEDSLWGDLSNGCAIAALRGWFPSLLNAARQTEGEITKFMGRGEAAARHELMELHGDAVEIDV
jgi:hypothetical protein